MSARIREYKANYFILRPESKDIVLQYQGDDVPVRIENNQIIMSLSVKDSEHRAIFIEGQNKSYNFNITDSSPLFLEAGTYTGGGLIDGNGHWNVFVTNQNTTNLTVTITPNTEKIKGIGRIRTTLPLRVFTNNQKTSEVKRLHIHLEYHFLSIGADD